MHIWWRYWCIVYDCVLFSYAGCSLVKYMDRHRIKPDCRPFQLVCCLCFSSLFWLSFAIICFIFYFLYLFFSELMPHGSVEICTELLLLCESWNGLFQLLFLCQIWVFFVFFFILTLFNGYLWLFLCFYLDKLLCT